MNSLNSNPAAVEVSGRASGRLDTLQALLQKQVAERARRLGRGDATASHPADGQTEDQADGQADDPEILLRVRAASSVRKAALTNVGEVAALLERVTGGGAPERHLRTGWGPVDEALGGGLRRNAVHEWFGEWSDADAAHSDPFRSDPSHTSSHSGSSRSASSRGVSSRSPWVAPMLILMHLARQALRPTGEVEKRAGLAIWIGRACWPSVIGLAHAGDLLRHSVLVDDAPRGNVVGERLWAIDLALRSPSVAVVIADGSGLDLAATRRLQLAAERGAVEKGGAGGAGLALLARPPAERSSLSAASTRWCVAPSCSGHHRSIGVRIELLRRKGLRPTCTTGAAMSAWSLEQDDATGDLHMVAGLAGGSAAPTAAQPVG